MRDLFNETARVLLGQGAFFTRPYGELASLVYEKAAGYAMTLRRVKKIFEELSSRVQDKSTDPYSAAEELLDVFLRRDLKDASLDKK